MTPEHAPDGLRRHHAEHVTTPRFRLRLKDSRSGHVDGAWWPQTAGNAQELPALRDAITFPLRARMITVAR